MASLIPPEGIKNHSLTFALKIMNFSFVYFQSLACLLKQTKLFTFICFAFLTPIDSSILMDDRNYDYMRTCLEGTKAELIRLS